MMSDAFGLRMLRWVVGSAVAVGLFASGEVSAESSLRYKFQAGTSTKYVMTQSMTMEMKLPQAPNPFVTKMQQKMYLEIATDEVLADGTARQRQIIHRITSSMTSEGGPVPQQSDFDSAADKEPEGQFATMLAKMFKPMVGAEWRQTVSPRGEVSDVKVPEKMLEGLRSNPAAAMMGNLATADGIKQISTQAAMVFPEGPLEMGDTWDATIDLKLPFGTMSTKKITKYVGPGEGDLERMQVTTEVQFQPSPDAPAVLKVVDNEANGEVSFDNKAGKLQKSTLRQVTSMEVSAGGQTIDQTVTTDVVFELDGDPAVRTESR